MLKPFAFGIASWQEQGRRIIDHLKSVNFSDSSISAFFPAMVESEQAARLHPLQPGRKEMIGRGFGEALGWIPAVNAETFPATMLDGGRPQGRAEIIALGLTAMGVPGKEAGWYGRCIRNGHVLISVQTISLEDVLLANEIFANNGAQDICIIGQHAGSRAGLPE